MSKVGKKPIAISSAKIEIKGNTVFINGPKAKFVHEFPDSLKIVLKDNFIILSLEKVSGKNNALWGLHRALLANKVKGAEEGFEKKVKIVGLGYKAKLVGKKINFSLGYSHKIDFQLPDGIEVKIDKLGQQLVFTSPDKLLLGNVCDSVKSLRLPEPYKGTGIIVEGDVVIRKAGKTKSAG
ncbi:50S ribosomal protein L6 [Candidatus Dependentiae bacterium]